MFKSTAFKPLRIATFGFRSLPPSNGSAGADKFALELLPRLVAMGHSVLAYTRQINPNYPTEYNGVRIKQVNTINKKGFDTLWHSFKCTCDIIFRNTADIIHIHNGGNSIWALPLRLFRKKVFISQDGVDWKRDKWSWYAKLYLKISSYITAYFPNGVIFDNLISKRLFEEKFKKKFVYIPYGSEVAEVSGDDTILKKFSLKEGEYYLFVGRFIPDKGLHYLIPAFTSSKTPKKLVIVGGSPNPSPYEKQLMEMANENVIFTGFVYGDDVTRLMKNAYAYIQPSDVEGLSPVILTVMGLGVPLIVSDIEENINAVEGTAITFSKSNIVSLTEKINFAEAHPDSMKDLARKAKRRAFNEFNWDKVTEEHIKIFSGSTIE